MSHYQGTVFYHSAVLQAFVKQYASQDAEIFSAFLPGWLVGVGNAFT